MRTEFLSGPATEPLLLDEVKTHLRIDGTSQDADLGALITASRVAVETYTGLVLINRQAAVFIDAWPGDMGKMPWWQGVAAGSLAAFSRMTEYLPLPLRPVSAIAAVTIYDADSEGSEWDTAAYGLRPGLEPTLYRQKGSWPKPGRAADGIRIDLTVGFGESWNAVPADIRQALLTLVAYLHESRGDTGGDAIKACGAAPLLAPYMRKQI